METKAISLRKINKSNRLEQGGLGKEWACSTGGTTKTTRSGDRALVLGL